MRCTLLLIPLLLASACLEHSAYDPANQEDSGTTDGGADAGTDGGGTDGGTDGGPDGGADGGGGDGGGPVCDNGIIEPGERCDQNCPTVCDDGNLCTTDLLIGQAADCDAACDFQRIEACVAGDGCCPAGCTRPQDDDCPEFCGNGALNPGETCESGSCPTEGACSDGLACTQDLLLGNPSACTAVCAYPPVIDCGPDDGCCPAGCLPATDADCSATCGNGSTEGSELCDGDCPTTCDDADPCTVDLLVGSAETCSARCSHQPVAACVDGDGCCPAGCSRLLVGPTGDSDCADTCGDGVLEASEACEFPYQGFECNFGTDGPGLCDPLTCQLDTGRCTPVCGDSQVVAPETCDTGDFESECNTLGRSYDSGTASCSASCVLDDSGCGTCGNDLVDGDERCDDASDLNCDANCQFVNFTGAFPDCTGGFDPVFAHALVVAAAGDPNPLSTSLVGDLGVTGLVPGDWTASIGRLQLAADGTLDFLPGPTAERMELGFDYTTAAGTGRGCLVVVTVDKGGPGVAVNLGTSWDSGANWSTGVPPDNATVAIIDAAGLVSAGDPGQAAALYLGNAASLSFPASSGTRLAVGSVYAGGSTVQGHLQTGASGTAAGRLSSVHCNGILTLAAPTTVFDLQTDMSCALGPGQWRLTVEGALTLGAGSSIVQDTAGSSIVLEGDVTLAADSSTFSDGELLLTGRDIFITDAGGPNFTGGHLTTIRSDSLQNISIGHLADGSFQGTGLANISQSLTVSGTLTLDRPVMVNSGIVDVGDLILGPNFSTTTTSGWQYLSCNDSAGPGTTCAQLNP